MESPTSNIRRALGPLTRRAERNVGAPFGPRLCRRPGAAADFVQAGLEFSMRHGVRTPLRLVLCTQPRSVDPELRRSGVFVETTAPNIF
jgi:hypothetical protein